MNGMRRSRAPRPCGSPRMRLTLMWFLPGSMPARGPHPVRMGWTRDSSSRTRPFVWRRKQVGRRLPSGPTRGASTRLCSWVASMKPRWLWRSRHNIRMSSATFVAGQLALMGRLEDARLALRQVEGAGLEIIGPPMAWLPAMALLTEAIAATHEEDLAAAVYARLLPHARLNVSAGAAGLYGSVSRYLGMLAATLERWDEAAERYEQAIEYERRMGARPSVVRSQIAYAEMLLTASRAGDLVHARNLLETAIAGSRELGMVPWQEHATRLVKDLEGRGRAGHPLPSRQYQAAALD